LFLAAYVLLLVLVLLSTGVLVWVMLAGRTRQDTTTMAPLVLVTLFVQGAALFALWITDGIRAYAVGVYTPVGFWTTLGLVGYWVLVMAPIGFWVLSTRKRNGWTPRAR
jgi:Zn-dependent protease with chaperone function